jgi:hypothetical protein
MGLRLERGSEFGEGDDFRGGGVLDGRGFLVRGLSVQGCFLEGDGLLGMWGCGMVQEEEI